MSRNGNIQIVFKSIKDIIIHYTCNSYIYPIV